MNRASFIRATLAVSIDRLWVDEDNVQHGRGYMIPA
jgi:hypothetical protein